MKIFIVVSCLVFGFSCTSVKRDDFTIVAHRGASGYLPEHTLEGAAMAHSWDVDYIEPDVVMTKDNRLVIMHDHHIDTTTNVKEVYPRRKRKDGRYYAVDFTLKELKRLRLHERKNLKTNKRVFPKRFPFKKSKFEIPTLEEFIELVQGLNESRDKAIGIYPEIKKPEFHQSEKKDIAAAVLKTLRKYGYEESGQAIIQCFYPPTLKRLKNEFKTKIPLVQLVADDSWGESSANYSEMLTEDGIKEVASYASGLGPWIPQVLRNKKIVTWAHKYNMQVHPYTHRIDSYPEVFKDSEAMLKYLINETKIDGIFSDFGDQVVDYFNN